MNGSAANQLTLLELSKVAVLRRRRAGERVMVPRVQPVAAPPLSSHARADPRVGCPASPAWVRALAHAVA